MDGTFLLSNSNSYRTLRHIKSGMKETRTMRNFDSNHGYDGQIVSNFYWKFSVMYVYYLSKKSDN